MGVNNPHLRSIPDDYKICEPVPNHPLLENVYYPEDIVKGYMWACRFSYCLEPHSPVTILISQQSIGHFASVIKLFYRVEDLAAVVAVFVDVVDIVSHFISQEYEKFNLVTKLFHRVEFLAAVVVAVAIVVIVVVVVVTHFTIIMVSSTMLQNCFTGLKTWLQLCRRCLSYLPSSFSCDFLCLALQNAQNKLFSNLNTIFILSQYMVHDHLDLPRVLPGWRQLKTAPL